MIYSDLATICKHRTGCKILASGKVLMYCKAFPDGNGIPEHHPCNFVSEIGVLTGKREPPKDCGNGFGFEFPDDYEDAREVAKRMAEQEID